VRTIGLPNTEHAHEGPVIVERALGASETLSHPRSTVAVVTDPERVLTAVRDIRAEHSAATVEAIAARLDAIDDGPDEFASVRAALDELVTGGDLRTEQTAAYWVQVGADPVEWTTSYVPTDGR
jgi:hypothetical protein